MNQAAALRRHALSHDGHGLRTFHKGVGILIAPAFEQNDFYERFTERNGHLLDQILEEYCQYMYVEYIEVQEGLALIHQREQLTSPRGYLFKTIPVQVIDVEWVLTDETPPTPDDSD